MPTLHGGRMRSRGRLHASITSRRNCPRQRRLHDFGAGRRSFQLNTSVPNRHTVDVRKRPSLDRLLRVFQQEIESGEFGRQALMRKIFAGLPEATANYSATAWRDDSAGRSPADSQWSGKWQRQSRRSPERAAPVRCLPLRRHLCSGRRRFGCGGQLSRRPECRGPCRQPRRARLPYSKRLLLYVHFRRRQELPRN